MIRNGVVSRRRAKAVSGAICLAGILSVSAHATVFEEVYGFQPAPANPAGGLTVVNGTNYGTSFAGGAHGLGTIFSLDPQGNLTVLFSFAGANGAYPRGTMVRDASGNFYGITYGGGVTNAGTVFKFTLPNTLTVLHDFANDPGANPYGGLLMGTDGYLYGTTETYGTVFRVTTWGFFQLLTSYFGQAGYSVQSGLSYQSGTSLYGIASVESFTPQGGIFYSVSMTNGAVTVLSSFGGTQGDKPMGGMVSPNGAAFALASGGGSYGNGSILWSDLYSQDPSVQIPFAGTNGAFPIAPLLLTSNSTVYGGTMGGGQYGLGTIFAAYAPLSAACSFNGTNGAQVDGKMVEVSNRVFRGTTRSGGAAGNGTIFSVDFNGNTNGTGVLTTLSSLITMVGSQPVASLVSGAHGILYGVSAGSGGAVFQIGANGKLTPFANFASMPGAVPDGPLMIGSDGNFYGTTFNGGPAGDGTLFQLTPGGTMMLLHSFSGADGANPYAGVIQGADGMLYGTTSAGGNGYGTVFKSTTGGAVTAIHSFNGADGATPYAGLVQGEDGSFYGATYSGGVSNLGTVFQIASDGTFNSLYSFSGADGANPEGTLTQGSDGALYGTTVHGGTTNGSYPSGCGTVFRIPTNGALTTLKFFVGNNGANPYAPLVQGPDGNFYGTTAGGGVNGVGTVFELAGDGTLTALHSFATSDGANPHAGLVFGADGYLYGATTSGGSEGSGNVFRIYTAPYLQAATSQSGLNLSWPASAAGFLLEYSTDLSVASNWTTVPGPFGTNGLQLNATAPSGSGARYYRLRKP